MVGRIRHCILNPRRYKYPQCLTGHALVADAWSDEETEPLAHSVCLHTHFIVGVVRDDLPHLAMIHAIQAYGAVPFHILVHTEGSWHSAHAKCQRALPAASPELLFTLPSSPESLNLTQCSSSFWPPDLAVCLPSLQPRICHHLFLSEPNTAWPATPCSLSTFYIRYW